MAAEETLIVDRRKEGEIGLSAKDIIKVLSTIMVFMLHTSIFSSQFGFAFDERTWFLKTPAWAAVWIFFFLSGNNIGKGFVSGRYKENGKYTIRSVLRFYLSRFIKIGLPVWCFSVMLLVLVEPENFFGNPVILLRIFTFTYTAIPGSDAVGATWYVSTLMWLYLIAPILMMLLEQIVSYFKTKGAVVMWLLLIVLGFYLRWWLFHQGVDWSSKIYVPFYCNIDLYGCGMLCNLIPRKKLHFSKLVKIISGAIMAAVLMFNIRIYYLSDWNPMLLVVYCYVLPSVYIVALTLIILAYEDKPQKSPLKAAWIFRKCFKLFGAISFEFYLVHSAVLHCIAPALNAFFVDSVQTHIALLIVAFCLTIVIAVVLHQFTVELSKRRRLCVK